MIDINSNPILTVTCEEPEGTVTRNVYPFIFTQNNLKLFYEKASRFPTLFNRCLNKDHTQFREMFWDNAGNIKGLFWVIDDLVGLYYLTDIYIGQDATVHYTFFDKRHKGREEITKKMIDYVFSEYCFNRLSVEIPSYTSEHTEKFVKKLGFEWEGKKKSAVRYMGRWFDINFFGLLSPAGLADYQERMEKQKEKYALP